MPHHAQLDFVKSHPPVHDCSVKETDWRAELEAFKKGVADDTQVVQQRTATAVQEGRTRLESLPQQAQRARLPQVTPQHLQHLNQVLNSKPSLSHEAVHCLACRMVVALLACCHG